MSELTRLCESKDFAAVRSRYRDCAPTEVLTVADRLRRNGFHRLALELYQWLLGRNDSAEIHFGVGQCHGKIGDFDAALRHLDLVFGRNSTRSDGAGYYAYVLERHGRMEESNTWYRQALAGVEADDLWVRSHYAWFLEKWGCSEDACRAYDDVLERNPSYTWALKRYALLLRSRGDETQAEAMLREAAERAPGNRYVAVNYLEYLLLTDNDQYLSVRASLAPTDGPEWYAVVLELFDYYREHLLPSRPDPTRLAAWEAAAEALSDSVHRDFDDLTALLLERGGDVDVWRRQIRLLLK